MSDLYTCNKHADDYDFCPICKIEQLTKERDELRTMLDNSNRILQEAQEKCGVFAGCDSPIEFADLIIELRAELEAATKLKNIYHCAMLENSAELEAIKAQEPVAYRTTESDVNDRWFLYRDADDTIVEDFNPTRIALYPAPTSQQVPTKSALERIKENGGFDEEMNPVEQLRFFLSLALHGRDWLDVEQFIDAVQVPEGMTLVPREPTETMVIAGCRHENMGDMAGRYKAMIAAHETKGEM